ncbi:MAG TPA: LysM peptidoglycan-binding domain-containing protein [Thermomicrobiales bacterium]|jgi:LysM repeat protein
MQPKDMLQRRGWLALPLALALGICPPAALVGAAPGIHTVQQGETLSGIAEAYGVPLVALAETNGIANPDLIITGTTLQLGGEGGRTTADTATTRVGHRVGAGENLEGIAAAYDTNVAALLAANPELTDPDVLFVGQVLIVPTTTTAVASDSTAALLATIALDYGLDPTLIQAIAWQESGWQQGVTSAAGATGIMQILPETGEWVASDIVGAPLNIADSANDNVTAGVALFSWLIEQSGDEDLALAYYVQGQGSIASAGIFPETWQYIANIRAIQTYIIRYGAPPN